MTAAPMKVLVIDDEAPMRKLLRLGLTSEGYELLEASNGRLALDLLSRKPGLVVLDLGLPDIDGFDLLRMIRSRDESVPIVVLSSDGAEDHKVRALDLGADDYVTKPFGLPGGALRHKLQVQGERPVFRSRGLTVDLVRRIVQVDDKEVKLSPKEYDLLRVMVMHAGKVLTHRFLLHELWNESTGSEYLRVYVRQLRQKIEADPERPVYIMTEIGVGYRLRAADGLSKTPPPAAGAGQREFSTRFDLLLTADVDAELARRQLRATLVDFGSLLSLGSPSSFTPHGPRK